MYWNTCSETHFFCIQDDQLSRRERRRWSKKKRDFAFLCRLLIFERLYIDTICTSHVQKANRIGRKKGRKCTREKRLGLVQITHSDRFNFVHSGKRNSVVRRFFFLISFTPPRRLMPTDPQWLTPSGGRSSWSGWWKTQAWPSSACCRCRPNWGIWRRCVHWKTW